MISCFSNIEGLSCHLWECVRGGGSPPLNDNCYYGGSTLPCCNYYGGSTGGQMQLLRGVDLPHAIATVITGGVVTPLCVSCDTCGCRNSHVAAPRHLRLQACTYKEGSTLPCCNYYRGSTGGSASHPPQIIVLSQFISAIV